MKKLIAFLLALAMILSLTACGGGKKAEAKNDAPAATDAITEAAGKYNVDLTAEGEQKMSEERATMEVLVETKDVWLEGNTMFFNSDKTYADFVEHIGCDASVYSFDGSNRNFIWYPEGSDSARIIVSFQDSGNGWLLSAFGSLNIK